jgi:toxin ParE1/3/4
VSHYQVHFSAAAVTDLDQLYISIANRASFEIADRYLAKIELFCRSLSTFPNRGTAVSGPIYGLRTTGFKRRVTILFHISGQQVDILRILYGGRDLEPLIAELPEEWE